MGRQEGRGHGQEGRGRCREGRGRGRGGRAAWWAHRLTPLFQERMFSAENGK